MGLEYKIKKRWINLNFRGKSLVIGGISLITILIIWFISWIVKILLNFYVNNIILVVATLSITILLVACVYNFLNKKKSKKS